jgi:hypothetical protein
MKLRYTAIATLLAWLAIGSTGTQVLRAEEAAPAAVLMSCSGEVTVVRANGTTVAGSFGFQLQAGDKVKTGADGSAEVMLDDGTWLQVGANSGMQIKSRPGTSAQPAKSEKSFDVVQNFIKLKDTEGTSSLSGLRGDDKGELVAVSPGQTRIRTDRPTLMWEIADPSQELRVTVYDESGVYWQRDAKGTTSLAYPADVPELKSGTTWSWTVETSDPLVIPPLRSQAVYFEVISREEDEMLNEALAAIESEKKPGKSTYHLMRASLFFDHGLIEDAIAETHIALTADPENQSLHAILARLYAEAGHTREAYQSMLETQNG